MTKKDMTEEHRVCVLREDFGRVCADFYGIAIHPGQALENYIVQRICDPVKDITAHSKMYNLDGFRAILCDIKHRSSKNGSMVHDLVEISFVRNQLG